MSIVHAQMNFRCGDDWDFSATLEDPSGNILNLTGAQSITWRLDTLDLSKNIISLGIGSGVSVTNATGGLVAYGPTGAQTTSIPPGTYYDTLRVVMADGSTFTMIEGIVNASPAMS